MTNLKLSQDNSVPDFIGIGAMRCGTTWIAERLREHPEIHIPADFKELHFFDDYYHQGLEWYRANFSETKPHQICGEFTPSYLRTEGARERIQQDFPNTKLIISLRDPLARATSHHNFLRIRTDISESLIEALKDERYDLLKAGLYGEQLSQWLQSFPSEQIHIILFDDIQNHPKKVISELYCFLGVDHDFLPLGLVQKENVRHEVRSQPLAGFMRKMRQLIRPHIVSRQGLKRLGVFRIGKWVNSLNRTGGEDLKIQIPAEAVNYIKDYYREDIKLLESILGRDLSAWK